jgi:multiple sugar transport system permease protein
VTRPHPLIEGLLWTAPWWLGFLLWIALPMGASLFISFTDYPLLQPPVWIGMENYARLVEDGIFHQVVANTLIYTALAVPLLTVVAIAVAVLLNQRLPGQAVFRACVFVPSIVPLVAAAVVWSRLLGVDGIFNQLLTGFGALLPLVEIPPVPWMQDPQWAMLSVVFVTLWGVGSPVVIYLAGLQDIPEELYEAARLDGAGPALQFRHVTLPGLSPVILFNVVIAVITAWQVFALPFVLFRGVPGPERSVYFYTWYLFDQAFRYLDMGYASAMAWVQLLIILALTALVFGLSRKRVYYRAS